MFTKYVLAAFIFSSIAFQQAHAVDITKSVPNCYNNYWVELGVYSLQFYPGTSFSKKEDAIYFLSLVGFEVQSSLFSDNVVIYQTNPKVLDKNNQHDSIEAIKILAKEVLLINVSCVSKSPELVTW